MGYLFLLYNVVYDIDVVSEFNEEDVWDLGNDGLFDINRVESLDIYGYVNFGRRWMGIDNKEFGLFVVFVENI